MDLPQLTKKLEWLDEERRKDKNTIAALEERIGYLENTNTQQLQHLNELSGDVARLQSVEGHLKEYDIAISQIRVEIARSLETIEKQRTDRDREIDRIRLGDVEQVHKITQETSQFNDKVDSIKKEFLSRKDEILGLARSIEEVKKNVEDNARIEDEFRRSQNVLEDRRRTEGKRIADLQGEVAALRKRIEEQRGKQDVYTETLRKLDLKIAELVNAETERRQMQISFIEKTNVANVERDRLWKDWQSRFEDIDKKSGQVDSQIQSLESTFRTVKRSQESLDEVTQRFERRINEITEMQRLSEERFRNEWSGFKADDQKRWANTTLNQDEAQREVSRLLTKMNERLASVEDAVQDIQYQLQQVMESANKRMVSLYNTINQWMSNEDSE